MRIRYSFKAKLSVAICSCLIVTVLLSTIAAAYMHYRYLENFIQSRLRSVALTAASLIDPDVHETLRRPADMANPEYMALIKRLNAILSRDPSIKFIYTLRPLPPKKGQPPRFAFVLDGGSAGKPLDPSNPDFSKIGDVYDKLPPVARAVFRTGEPAADEEPVRDQWGMTLSGYAPIKNAKGRVVAILGVDMTADELGQRLRKIYALSGIAALFSILVGLVLAYRVSRKVMGPVEDLYDATLRVADGDLTTPIEFKRQDEFALVLGMFNRMMKSVRGAQSLLVQQAKLESDLKLAATVQNQLFHWEKIDRQDLAISHFVRTADSTGGDWAHYHLSHDRYLFMLVGDVVGHGVASAMVAAAVAGCFESLKVDIDAGEPVGVYEILQYMQKVVSAAGRGQFPMTMFVIKLDLATGEIQFSSAGHPAARVATPTISANASEPPGHNVRSLFQRSDYLGDVRTQDFVVRTARVAPGDFVVVFSDGLVERRNASGKGYGARRLERTMQRFQGQGPKELCEAIINDVERFADGSSIDDDISLIVAQYLGAASSRTDKAS